VFGEGDGGGGVVTGFDCRGLSWTVGLCWAVVWNCDCGGRGV